MEIITFIISLFILILSIVMIVKFFQIARNVEEITRILSIHAKRYDSKKDKEHKTEDSGIQEGSNVVDIKTGQQLKVMEIISEFGNNIYVCSMNNGITNKKYYRSEIVLFSDFQNK